MGAIAGGPSRLTIHTRTPPAGPLSGVCAALLVPRSADHSIDLAAMEALIAFHMQHGVQTFALNGATGEYPRNSLDEVRDLLSVVRALLGIEHALVLGVGSADTSSTQSLLDLGDTMQVDGFLLPVPHYFPLQQEDIQAFVSCLQLHRPTYMYNLPSFTTAIAPGTALSLCQSTKGLVGVKDSSGSLDTVRLLKENAPEAARIMGNDGVLFAALSEGLCDGVVSGVAGVLPELLQRLYVTVSADSASDDSVTLRDTLTQYITWLDRFPVPWGLKLTAEFRGIFPAEFSLPLSEERRASALDFMQWLAQNRARLHLS